MDVTLRRTPTRWRLPPRARRGLLLVHVVAAGAWVGIDVLLAVLVGAGRWATDDQVRAAAYLTVATLVLWPMLAVCLTTLVTGLVLGWGTRWGLTRHWWVLVKLAITVVLTVLIVVALRPDLPLVAEHARRLAAGTADPAPDEVSSLLFPPVVSLSALGLAMWLSIFKPWGRRAGGSGDRSGRPRRSARA